MIRILSFLIIISSLIFNFESALAYDFAPEVNDIAPNFQLTGIDKKNKFKKEWNSNDFIGSWTVLYFYPKDFTSGCTLEAKGLSELNNEFSKYT